MRLRSPDESVQHLARLFERGGNVARLEVGEDKCFQADSWLGVGRITVFPSSEQEDIDKPVEQALRFGSYGWSVPPFDSLLSDCEHLLRKPSKKTLDRDKIRRALEALLHCAVRCGFVNPIFDAGSVADMPFNRPTTIVVDTSAVLQGGLDFVARFLYPMARIKVPAIAHMEILNLVDRYFSQRRANETKFNSANALLDHVTSQAGQRVLLRLELQTETEIERPRLGADPLRGIVQVSPDSEDKALGLQHIQRSFADRLILETAIVHRDRLSPDHPVVVLTADQGLARMTLAEGLQSLFFFSPAPDQVCRKTLLATCFRPIVDETTNAPFFYIPLATLVWELACTFGAVRLVTDDGFSSFVVAAMGEGLSWHPFHSKDDLLWTSTSNGEEATDVTVTPTTPNKIDQPSQPSILESTVRVPQTTLTGAYRFSVESMFKLVFAFETRNDVRDRDGMRLLGLSIKTYSDLRNFLLSGSFADRIDTGLTKRPALDALIDATKSLNLDIMKKFFLQVPSVKVFIEELEVGKALPSHAVSSIAQSAVPTYVKLAVVCGAALDVAEEGLFATPHSPPPLQFVAAALDVYRYLKNGEEYVLTGKWLEQLAVKYGIHPLRSRERLNEARAAGLIERYTEGSTPETQFERHTMELLEIKNGAPTVRRLNLYHGDFLIPGKASVSIRLEEVQQ